MEEEDEEDKKRQLNNIDNPKIEPRELPSVEPTTQKKEEVVATPTK